MQTFTKFALVAILLIIIGVQITPYFAGEKSIQSIAFAVGGLEVHWYGITMALAILASALVSLKFAVPALKIATEEQFLSASLWMIAGGVIGARLLFVMLKWSEYSANLGSIFLIGEGGLSLHGAILGGWLSLWLYASQNRLEWRKLADLAVVGIPVGQAIGRFGNFFNQEAFGGATNLPWKMYVAPAFRPESLGQVSFFHPTFAYEVILNLAIFGLLLIFLSKYKFSGQLFLIYIGLYSAVRFGVEFFRVDSDQIGILSVAQWASLVILIWSIILYYRWGRDERRETREKK